MGLLLLGWTGCRTPAPARCAPPDALTVGTPGDYAPFSLWGPEGPVGADVELVQAVFPGARIEWVRTSWGALMDDLGAGRFALAVGGISVTPARRERARFSQAYLRAGKLAVMRCADLERFGDYAAVEQRARVIYNHGGTNERFARARFEGAKGYEDNTRMAQRLLEGAGDVFFTDGVEARHIAAQHAALCVGLGQQQYEPSDFALLIAADAANLQRCADAFLGSARGRAEWAEIRARHGLPTADVHPSATRTSTRARVRFD